jgi:hypothetical protein
MNSTGTRYPYMSVCTGTKQKKATNMCCDYRIILSRAQLNFNPGLEIQCRRSVSVKFKTISELYFLPVPV